MNIEDCADYWDQFPNISHGDIYHCLVHSTNSVTNVQMKAYKSLESHNYFTSGWVNPPYTSQSLAAEETLASWSLYVYFMFIFNNLLIFLYLLLNY